VAVMLLLLSSTQVIAGEMASGGNTTSADSSGLLETNEAGTVNFTINSGGALTFGADATASVTLSESSAATTLNLAHTLSSGTATITLAGDIVVSGHAGNVINIVSTATNSHLDFQGNVTATLGTINITSAASNTTHIFTFDNKTAEDHIIDAVISEGQAGATSTVNVTRTLGSGSNTATFQKTITVDTIAIAAGATAIFNGLVTGATTITSANTTTYNAGHTGNIAFASGADGTISVAADKIITGNVTNGADGQGTLTLAAPTADRTLVTGTTGSGSDALKVLNVAVLSHDTTFGNIVLADTINITQASGTDGTVVFSGDVVAATGMVLTGADVIAQFASGGSYSIGSGAITTATTDTGELHFLGSIQAVDGAVGASSKLLKLIQVSGNGDTTFSGPVYATTTTIDGTSTVAMAASQLLTSNVNFTGATGGTLRINTGNFTGNVTTANTGRGTVSTAGAATFTGTMGASGAIIAMVDINHTAGITGSVYATEVDIDVATLSMSAGADITGNVDFSQDGVLALASGADVTGTILPSGGDGMGTVNVAGTSTITGQIGNAGGDDLGLLALTTSGAVLSVGSGIEATAVTLAAGTELKYIEADNVTAHTGNLVVTGTGKVNVGTATVTVSGTLTMPATSTFMVTIGDTNGKLVHSTAASAFIATTGLLEPVIAGRIISGTGITVFAGAAAPNLPSVTDNYDRYSFALAVCNTNDLCLTPTLVTPAGVSAAGAAVNKVADVAFAADTAMSGALNLLSGAALDKALVSLAPAVDGGAIVGSISAGSASGATISTQIASLRSGIAAGSGLNAGDGTNDKRFWTQGFGTTADQDVREKINGFKSTTGGVAFGVDKRVRPDTLVGVAYSFSHTDVDTKESKNGTKVKGHQATFYGTHGFDRGIFGTDGVFVDGQLSYAYNDYSGTRYIEVGAVTRKADSEFDGSQISTKFDLGKTVNFTDKLRFTPTAGVSYTHVAVDKFTETGAGDSSLSLKKQDYDILNLNVRAKLARTWEVNGADVTPEMHVGYSYEAIHDKIQTTSNFTGGGASFISTGFKPANHTYSGGMGLTFGASDKMPVDVTFTYDFSGKDDFESHSGLVKGAWKF